MAEQVTAVASANIAFIKYWGNLDPALRLPFHDSLSMNLSAATTTTTASNRREARWRMSRCPFVGGSKVPGSSTLNMVRG